MSDRIDESLLESPLPPPRQRSRWLVWLAAVVLIGVVAVALLSTVGAQDNASPGDDTSTSEPVDGSTAVTTVVSTVMLVEFTPEPALVYYPTLLPRGWQVCRQIEDVANGDRFCNPEDPSGYIQVAVKGTDLVHFDRGQPTGDSHGGVWLDQGDRLEVAYVVGASSAVIVTADGTGITKSDLLAVADTIPLVGRRRLLHGSYELPIDLSGTTDEQLAGLLTPLDPDARVTGRRPGEAQIFASEVVLSLFWGDGLVVPDFAASVPYPRLVPAARPLIAGESPTRRRSYAIWDQGGYGWRLELQGTAEDAAAIAADLIHRIADLPTE